MSEEEKDPLLMDEERLLIEMTDLVGLWKGYGIDSTDIDGMLYLKQRLSSMNFELAGIIGDVNREWKKRHARYESLKNQKRVSYLSKGTTKADWMARANCEKELLLSADYEGLYWGLYKRHESAGAIVNDIAQRISYLRKEKERANYLEEL